MGKKPKSYEEFEEMFAALPGEDEAQAKGKEAQGGEVRKGRGKKNTDAREEAPKTEKNETELLLQALQEAGFQAGSVQEALGSLRALQSISRAMPKNETAALPQHGFAAHAARPLPNAVLRENGPMGAEQSQNDVMQNLVREQRAAAIFKADKALVESVDPGFFTRAGEEQRIVFGALRRAGLDALAAHHYALARQPGKTAQTGTEHMVATKGRGGGAQGVPQGILKEFEEYGFGSANAKEHYTRLGGSMR